MGRTAVQAARRNQELNSIANVTFREGNTFDLLKEYDEVGRRFQMVILDPPAFREEPRQPRGGGARVQGDQSAGVEDSGTGRIPGHVFVLLPFERGAVPAADSGGRERREEECRSC